MVCRCVRGRYAPGGALCSRRPDRIRTWSRVAIYPPLAPPAGGAGLEITEKGAFSRRVRERPFFLALDRPISEPLRGLASTPSGVGPVAYVPDTTSGQDEYGHCIYRNLRSVQVHHVSQSGWYRSLNRQRRTQLRGEFQYKPCALDHERIGVGQSTSATTVTRAIHITD